ncbi:MAG: helix-turn-helix transcriptional regulator [Chloroflexi bacterium]|nr:helix-turn-helix transcriptional regulator [Chloroflexota bacterium]
MKAEDLYSGFVRLHVLHHASAGPIFGLWIIEELGRHGYRLSPGTLYPILHGMERAGYLASERQFVQGRFRRVYAITPTGREALAQSREKVCELFGELFEKGEGKTDG